jgi:transposase
VSAMQDCGHTPEWTGPIVERAMRNGKRLYTSAFKAWIVEQALKPGVSVATLAMRHGVNANQLRRWMRLKHWREAAAAPVMLPVTLAPSTSTAVVAEHAWPVIEIELAGAVVRVPAGADLAQLRTVLQALRT